MRERENGSKFTHNLLYRPYNNSQTLDIFRTNRTKLISSHSHACPDTSSLAMINSIVQALMSGQYPVY